MQYAKYALVIYTLVIALFIAIYGVAFTNNNKTEAAGEIVVNLCGVGNNPNGNFSGFSNCGGSANTFRCFGSGAGSYCQSFGDQTKIRVYKCNDNGTNGGIECTSNMEEQGSNKSVSVQSYINNYCLVQIDVVNGGDNNTRDFVVVRNPNNCNGGDDGGNNNGGDNDDDDDDDDFARCGESCDSDSDCNAKGEGVTAVCRQGMCVNSECPTKTRPGANCECADENACGEECGIAVGLCQTGSRCHFVNIAQNQCEANENERVGTQICVPNEPNAAYEKVECTDGFDANVLRAVNSTRTLSQADIVRACQGSCNQRCGDSSNGRVCEPGLSCINDGTGVFRCRDASNPTSDICEETQQPALCNEACGASANGRTCAESNHSCVDTGNSQFRCRLTANPTSTTCQPAVNTVNCHRCTDDPNDANACTTPQTFQGTQCPSGYTLSTTPCHQAFQNNTCPTTPNNPNYSLSKVAFPDNDSNNGTSFELGDTAVFRIIVRNTGNVELGRVQFTDNYDQALIRLLGGSVSKYNANNQLLAGPINNLIPTSASGTFTINDLSATALGTLMPGEYYQIDVSFQAIGLGTATNYAITNAWTKGDTSVGTRNAQDSIVIVNQDTDI